MISKIYASDAGLKDFLSKSTAKTNKTVSNVVDINRTLKNYSLNNLQANYLPVNSSASVSFGRRTKYHYREVVVPETVPTGPNIEILRSKIISRLPSDSSFSFIDMPEEEKIIGSYYDKLTNDLSILLSSDKDATLVMDEGISPDIFASSFAKKLSDGNFARIGLTKETSDVIYITDPISYVIRGLKENQVYKMAPSEILTHNNTNTPISYDPKDVEEPSNFFARMKVLDLKNAQKEKCGIVFVQDFNKITSNLDRFYTGKNLKEYMMENYPNLSVVGLVDKQSMDLPRGGRLVLSKEIVAARNVVNAMEGIPQLTLSGLNIKEAEDFVVQNPIYTIAILDRYPQAFLDVSKNARKELLVTAAKYSDEALPGSFYTLLDRVAAAKMNEVKEIKKTGVLNITTADVKRFKHKHSAVLVPSANGDSRFKMLDDVQTRLSDVGGMSQVKEEIDDLVSFFRNPKKYQGKAPKGFLFEGNPGTGKTLLARAIAGETATPFFPASGSEFVEKYVGVGAARIRELYTTARKAAENSPNKTAIIFFDEFDALAKVREAGGRTGNDERESTLNQLLVELDGIANKDSDTKIVTLAATNRKDMLDPAVIRPGRFDDSLNIPSPKAEADRLDILNIHARKLKFENPAAKAKILEETAKITDGMSGAEMASVLEKAEKIVLKRTENKFITNDDVVEGFLRTIAGPIDKVQDNVPMKELENTVRHEGGHAVIIDTLRSLLGEKISFITLDPRGHFLGAVFHHKDVKMIPDFKSIILSAAVKYGGGMAEPDFDSIGTGAGVKQDLANATNLFRKAITQWGLGLNTPPISMVADGDEGDAFSEVLMNIYSPKIEKDIDLFSTTSRKIAKLIINFHRDFLDEYVERFKANAGKGGNNLSGEEFSNLRAQWIKQTGKTNDEAKLLKTVDSIINKAYGSGKNPIEKIFKKTFKFV